MVERLNRLVCHRYFLWAFIFLGIILRVIWVEDMEWHFDANWMFDKSQEILRTGNWPLLGMENGARFFNPSLGIWIFAIFGLVADSPTGMTQIVMFLNVLAILGFLIFAYQQFEGEERILWIKGIALASVSPLAILWSRKIWAQDILPIFSLIIIFAHYYRHRRGASFLWGFFGALIGQIHMSGFFFAFGVFIFSLVHDFINKKNTKWGWWIIGSCVGSIALLPWLHYLLNNSVGQKREIKYIFQFRFFTFWFMEAMGIHLKYTLKHAFLNFMKLPRIGGVPLYLIGLVHTYLWGISVYVIILLAKKLKKIDFEKFKKASFLLNISATDFYLYSLIIGMGLSLTLASVKIYAHYMIILFPFIHIWLAKILKNKGKLFAGILVAQAILSIGFFGKIHLDQVIPGSHYGKTYKQKCLVEKRDDCHLDWIEEQR